MTELIIAVIGSGGAVGSDLGRFHAGSAEKAARGQRERRGAAAFIRPHQVPV